MFGAHSERFTRLTLCSSSPHPPPPSPSPQINWKQPIVKQLDISTHVTQLSDKGYTTFNQLLSTGVATVLNQRLEAVLHGEFDTGTPPGKLPSSKLQDPWKPGKRTIQVVNIRHADTRFRSVICSPVLGKLVADVAGWTHGARVASDQVWCKPPTSGALSFHRDSAYFDFVPSDVMTVWIAFDDMVPEVGPLEYVEGSHKWGEGRVGSANQFFDKDRRRLMHDAARKEGFTKPLEQLKVHQVNVKAGGCGIHNGRTWHGSDQNRSKHQPRRGLGIHFVPANATFKSGELGKMWSKFRTKGSNVMPESEFPVTFRRPIAAQKKEEKIEKETSLMFDDSWMLVEPDAHPKNGFGSYHDDFALLAKEQEEKERIMHEEKERVADIAKIAEAAAMQNKQNGGEAKEEALVFDDSWMT